MKSKFKFISGVCHVALGAIFTLSASVAFAHPVDLPDGHVVPNINYGFKLIGQDTLDGVGTQKYSDVWSHKNFGYVASFGRNECDQNIAIHVVDLKKAIDQFPATSGAVVATLPMNPGNFAQDVKAHEIGGKDILFVAQEACSEDSVSVGIDIYDISDPSSPQLLAPAYLGANVHNMYLWTDDTNSSYMAIVNDDEVFGGIGFMIADVSDPGNPNLLVDTGYLDWLIEGTSVADDGQIGYGAFPYPLLHDVTVKKIDGRYKGILSYWDAGFILVDLQDPANPVFERDSTYPDPDLITGLRPEGNAHAAVFGGEHSEFVYAGDEDFDSYGGAQITINNVTTDISQVFRSQFLPLYPDSLTGNIVYVGSACDNGNAVPAPQSQSDIALTESSQCSTAEKAANITAAGFTAGILYMNDPSDTIFACEKGVDVSISPANPVPMAWLPRSVGFDALGIDGYDPSTCGGENDNGIALLENVVEGTRGAEVNLTLRFDGWGYLYVLNNTEQVVSSYFRPTDENIDVSPLGVLGYYAPAEVFDPDLAFDAGALTMHNVVADPSNQATIPTFDSGPRMFVSWYSLGMRALEHRPGHYHRNLINEGVYSWNVHEVGRYISEDGSNFWGVHVDEITRGKNKQKKEQIILGSDMNNGLYIFKYECVTPVDTRTPALYCKNLPNNGYLPELKKAVYKIKNKSKNNRLTVKGKLVADRYKVYKVEFFSGPKDESGECTEAGFNKVGEKILLADKNGNVSFKLKTKADIPEEHACISSRNIQLGPGKEAVSYSLFSHIMLEKKGK